MSTTPCNTNSLCMQMIQADEKNYPEDTRAQWNTRLRAQIKNNFGKSERFLTLEQCEQFRIWDHNLLIKNDSLGENLTYDLSREDIFECAPVQAFYILGE